MQEKTVEIRNLSIGYRSRKGSKTVAENLSATLFGGKLTCLMGVNGAGKSTLLRTLSGFQPKLKGEIHILGKSISAFSNNELARTTGVVLTERPETGELSVIELIGLGRSPHTGLFGRLNSEDETVIREVVSRIKIKELVDRPACTLSDGEWQKVMIAKTLAQETPVIFLDEPTAFLDFPSKVEIMRLMLDLTRSAGKTIFFSTHDLELALQIADTVWLLDRKKGITIGTPDELRLNGSIENFFKCKGVAFDRENGFFRIDTRSRLHYFNPGHETAVLNASKHYHPSAHIIKMQADLAFLPAWYAQEGDFVFMETPLPDNFMLSLEPVQIQVHPVTLADIETNRENFRHSTIELWGISPQSVHFFRKISDQLNLSLVVPCWKDEFRFLGSRFASYEVLATLLTEIPEIEKNILPRFYSDIETIEQQISHNNEQFLIKSPYSSSGRGLLWAPQGMLMQSERQILSGMLKKQSQVSIEKVLDKCIDFSMQFEISTNRETRFAGYSIFQTNSKGVYKKSLLAGQEFIKKQITDLIDEDLLLQTQIALSKILQKMYAPHYTGVIGVDMLIYKSGDSFRLHPCVEINMRKNMGYLAIRLSENYLHPNSQGTLFFEYDREPHAVSQKHNQLKMQSPLHVENKRIRSGYLNLCPVTDSTNYHSYIICFSHIGLYHKQIFFSL